jgi:hypothetical protein
MKPRLFIGSSSEGLPIARRFATSLASVANVVLWNSAPEFDPMRSTLEGLLESIERYDFGLFIFTPDDPITSRGVSENTARDNVILELGMFLGQLGRDRAFAVITEGTNRPIASKKYPTSKALPCRDWRRPPTHQRRPSLEQRNRFATRFASTDDGREESL